MVARVEFEEKAFDVGRTTVLQQLGRYDPTATRAGDAFSKTFVLPGGAVVRHTLRSEGSRVVVEVEGDDPDAELEHWRQQFPLRDGWEYFEPRERALERLHAAAPGLRIVRVPWLFDVAVGAVLQQRVTFADAARAFSRLADAAGPRSRFGPALPGPRALAALASHDLVRLGIDAKRARAVLEVAREEVRTRFLSRGMSVEDLRRRLLRLRGIGPWTTAMILGFGAGDTDAVPVGDVNLPSRVTQVLAGDARGTDERMLELLEPYRGQRFRVLRLCMSAPRPR